MKLFVFGLGYSATHFVREHQAGFASIAGTVRSDDKILDLARENIEALRFSPEETDPAIVARLRDSDAVLVSVQPGPGGDPVLERFADTLADSPSIRHVAYLSTIGVYGDHGGAWIDEEAQTVAANPRQTARVVAEAGWLDLARATGKAVTVLRLAGIYGPGRNALDDLRTGDARRIDKPGQVFNRIHVADIGGAVAAAFRQTGTAVVNVTDDEPAPAPDVVAYAAGLLGREPPPLIPFTEARLSPMARSFYGANRRVGNARLKRMGVALRYPNYRQGLDALWAAGEGRS